MSLPTITGLVHHTVEQAIRQIDTTTTRIDQQLRDVASQVQKPLTIDQIRRALGPSGATAPLNIFTLLGGGTTSAVQMGTHAQRVAQNPAALPLGVVFWETDRTAVYLTIAAQWVFIMGRPFACTIDSAGAGDTKPTDLSTRDEGFEIRSTDFDRIYRWTGSAWEDAAGQPRRFQIGYLTDNDISIVGWTPCNGATVRCSHTTGIAFDLTTPDLITNELFIRSTGGSTGGTGGAATHDHDVEIDSLGVQSGGGESAGAPGTYTTTPADTIPPFMYFRPYIRL